MYLYILYFHNEDSIFLKAKLTPKKSLVSKTFCVCVCARVYLCIVCECLRVFRFVRFVMMSSMSTVGRFVRAGGNYLYMLGLWPPQFEDQTTYSRAIRVAQIEHARMHCHTFHPIGQLFPRAQLH